MDTPRYEILRNDDANDRIDTAVTLREAREIKRAAEARGECAAIYRFLISQEDGESIFVE